MSLPDILTAAARGSGTLNATVPPTWLQGRTAYGGLSAALALETARGLVPDAPPLRSAQISFVGPLSGEVSVTAAILRQGRNATFVEARVCGESGVGMTATFVFMAPMDSKVDLAQHPMPSVPSPEEAGGGKPTIDNFFFNNFNWRYGLPRPAEPVADINRWVQLKERDNLHPMTELLAIADATPPAAMALMTGGIGPISSMTWLINILSPHPTTRDGWWFLRAESNYARAGCSSQMMSVWNANGEPVAVGMQSVALFA
jgi:acyl-CoA thioesterase